MKAIQPFILLAVFSCSMPSCNSNTSESQPRESVEWQTTLQSRLSAFGHRNWILIVDQAFPMQNGSGITYINSNEKLLPVLSYTLAELNHAAHVKPMPPTKAFTITRMVNCFQFSLSPSFMLSVIKYII